MGTRGSVSPGRSKVAVAEGRGDPEQHAIGDSVHAPVLAPSETAVADRALKVAVLCGLGYINLRGGLGRLREFLQGNPKVPHRVVKNREDVACALEEFAASGIDVLVVSGGDGTVSMVTTELLLAHAGGFDPLLVVLRGGRTNMTASDVGLRGDQVKGLRRVLAYAEAPEGCPVTVLERQAIGISSPGHDMRCGFFVGAGAIYQGSLATWKFRDESHVPGMRTGLGTAASVVKLVASHLVARKAFAPSRMGVTIDGQVIPETTWCTVFATTLSKLAFGIRPFWGLESGSIHMTGIAQQHKKLIRAASPALRGKRCGRLSTERGYHSHNGETIDLCLLDGVTLDGEIIRPEVDRLSLRVAGNLRFLRL